MFELPEIITLAGQMNSTLPGRTVQRGQLGNSPHKFVWYNQSHEEFERLSKGRTVGRARPRGKWLFIPLEPGYVFLLGECGGRVLYHPAGSELPVKYHLHLLFEDGSSVTATTQMWGAMELHEQGREQERQYVKDMRPTPLEPEFTLDYFHALIDDLIAEKKRSVKALLTQEQLIPGLGNAIAQDILFHARLHPKHALHELDTDQRKGLYQAILRTVQEVIDQGGRYDEVLLYGQPGGYIRIMDKNSVGQPCTHCGSTTEKMQYLGGACYFCPTCQR